MAYSITYPRGNVERKPILLPVSHYFIFGVLLIALILSVQVLLKEHPSLFHPLTDHQTQEAWAEMTEQIGQGSPVSEALEAFCRQILNNGPVH